MTDTTKAPSHIRLWLSDRGDTGLVLIPVAGTVFMLDENCSTVAVLANGAQYKVEETFADIQEALDCIVIED